MGDANINSGACWNVARLATLLLFLGAEEPGVVALLYHYEGDAGLIIGLQFYTGLPDGGELMLENLNKLTLADAISVHDDPMWLEASSGLVKHHEMILDHGGQVLNDLTSVSLNSDCGGIS